uniref:Uncharacterized protein n=1 Tax=Glossina brevipalpis TaxID=37001 RepID=A0A1A9VZZ6_9MUSC
MLYSSNFFTISLTKRQTFIFHSTFGFVLVLERRLSLHTIAMFNVYILRFTCLRLPCYHRHHHHHSLLSCIFVFEFGFIFFISFYTVVHDVVFVLRFVYCAGIVVPTNN